jgi:hypothetical protein
MVALMAMTLPLCGCSVGDHEIAKRCGVTERQVQAAFAEVQALAPYQSQKIGRCTFTRSDGQRHRLVLITGGVGQAESQ